jgi:rhodanese-related sulfurtransferase
MTTNLRLSPAELKSAMTTDPELRIIDVRTTGEFESAHIPGAYNVPLDQLPEHSRELSSVQQTVVLVCQSGARAAKAEESLRAAGLCNMRLLEGGMGAWSTAGLPVKVTKARWSLERQVRLVAGSIVLISILLSIAFPWTRFIGGFIGAGLTFAALSNTCAMGMMLAKLPYNRGASCDLNLVVRQIQGAQGRATAA